MFRLRYHVRHLQFPTVSDLRVGPLPGHSLRGELRGRNRQVSFFSLPDLFRLHLSRKQGEPHPGPVAFEIRIEMDLFDARAEG